MTKSQIQKEIEKMATVMFKNGAEHVFSRKFPDYTGLKTRLSELSL